MAEQDAEPVYIKTFENDSHFEQTLELECAEFTWNCPRNHAPDWGVLQVVYTPYHFVAETKSLKEYLLEFRKHDAYAEEIVDMFMCHFLYDVQPKRLSITLRQNSRGGISNKVSAIYDAGKAGSEFFISSQPRRIMDFSLGWDDSMKGSNEQRHR